MAETTSSSRTLDSWDGQDRRGPSRQDDEARARKLLMEYKAGGAGAAAARESLVLQFRPLVQKQARQFMTQNVPLEDLIQEGFLGLMHGIDQYDPTRGVKLITYTTHHIDGHLRHFLRDRTQIIKEPAWLQEIALKIRREAESLTQELGHEPSDGEVAASLGLSEAEVARIRATRSIFAVQSLDEAQENATSRVQLAESNAQSARTELPIEDKVVLEHAMARLKEIEQKVLYSFYYEDRSQTDIAKALGVSNNYVSHILKNSARKLQQMFRSDAVREAALQHERKRRRLAAHGPAALSEEAEEAPPTIIDPVTSLYTRVYFDSRLEEELSRARRHHLELSIIRVRVEGDLPEAALFARIAQVVKDCMRRSDLVARYDEHELAALLPHTGATRETVITRLESRLGELVTTFPHPVLLSLGRASYPAQLRRQDLLAAALPSESVQRPAPVSSASTP
jgi:RNA polymerase sigma factor (sigma-70 family)